MYFSIFVNISFEVAMCFDINVDELWEKPSYKIHAKIIIIVHYRVSQGKLYILNLQLYTENEYKSWLLFA